LGIEPDPTDPDHAYAILDRGTLLDFESNIPRTRADGTRYESTLPVMGGNNTSAVRLLSDDDFAEIIEAGLLPTNSPDTLPRDGAYPETGASNWKTQEGIDVSAIEGPLHDERTRVLASRLFRDQTVARIPRPEFAHRA